VPPLCCPASPRRASRAGAYQVPADLDLRSLARSLAPREPTETAMLAIKIMQHAVVERQYRRRCLTLPVESDHRIGTVAVTIDRQWARRKRTRIRASSSFVSGGGAH